MTEGGRVAEASNGSPPRTVTDHRQTPPSPSVTPGATTNHSPGSNPSSVVVATISPDSPIKSDQLFGPFSDPLQWIACKYAEAAPNASFANELSTIDPAILDLFRTIEIARNTNESNMEIILKSGQFYFRSLVDCESSPNRKLFAWFSDELATKLPSPIGHQLNGGRRYSCALCNQVFINPNPVVVHILFSCPKRHELLPTNNSSIKLPSPPVPNSAANAINKSPSPPVTSLMTLPTTTSNNHHQQQVTPKKRGFDIASLVEKDDFPTNDHHHHHQQSLKRSRKSEQSQLSSVGITGHQHNASASLQSLAYEHHHLQQQAHNHGHHQVRQTDSKSAFRTPLNPPPTPSGMMVGAGRNHHHSSSSTLTPTGGSISASLLSSMSGGGNNSMVGSQSVSTSCFPSAFKKVDASSKAAAVAAAAAAAGLQPLLSSGSSHFDLMSLYGRAGVASLGGHTAASLFHGQNVALSHQLMSSSPGSSSTAANLASQLAAAAHAANSSTPSVSQHSGSGVGSNSNSNHHQGQHHQSNNSAMAAHHQQHGGNGGSGKVIPSALLPFLPPSLAALSFPQTNWCAKCNATFRMTSDLVYHMRSHHKSALPADPIKKKREEKLRCNICGETFRERHHLTRHMTSHQ